MKCRFCKNEDLISFLDLGSSPPSNANIKMEQLDFPEVYYPLRTVVCKKCFLVQTEDYLKSSELFEETYTYFSSASKSWLTHSKLYVDMIKQRLNLHNKSFVVEIASNDGYLLKNFQDSDIPCLGIEPTRSTAEECRKKGIQVYEDFFSKKLSIELVEKYGKADLVVGNNVFAHVPDVNDFIQGVDYILKDEGTVTLEFPHILQLIIQNQFDTIYHEHFSYFSFHVVCEIFRKNGLKVYDVEKIETHGGSLRIFGCKNTSNKKIVNRVDQLLKEETDFGLQKIETYAGVQPEIQQLKLRIINYFISQKLLGKRIYGYGAAAKGNTLLNYCGLNKDIIELIFDAAPSKQYKSTPGSRIPIYDPDQIADLPTPDIMVIFPWNIKSEIISVLRGIDELKDIDVVTLIPDLKVTNL